jgi:putative DNA primase/helicase
MSAANIAEALGSHYRSGGWWRCRCPVHQSSRATLALRDTASGLAVCCHAGCPATDVRGELRRLGLLSADMDCVIDIVEADRQRRADGRRRKRRIIEALYSWREETIPPQGTVVERYWVARGLAELPIPETIRTSGSWLRHAEGSRPAMVALVQHVAAGPVAIHRTWLAIDGSQKAAFREPRLSLGPIGGGSVRLAPASDHQPLVIAEGIETAASVMLATGYPAWAALCAGGIAKLVLPPLPLAASVIIAADHDINGVGQRAAWSAAGRWLDEGRRVRVAVPKEPGTDFNDVLQTEKRRAA